MKRNTNENMTENAIISGSLNDMKEIYEKLNEEKTAGWLA